MTNLLTLIKDKGIEIQKSKSTPFSILSIMYNEVSRKEITHSNIFKAILSPNSEHKFNNAIIDSFFKRIVGNGFDINKTEDLQIYTEFPIKGRFIDILITWMVKNEQPENKDKKHAVIIENKLNYAVDQSNQLNDYCKGINEIGYKVDRIVYMHCNPDKTVKDTDSCPNVLGLSIDFNINELIKWLDECIKLFSDFPQISHLIIYRDLLININANKYNLMKASEIQSKLNNEQILELIDLASIVNSNDWHNAKYMCILDNMSTKKLSKVPKVNKKGKYAEFFYRPYKHWIELWTYDKRIDLFVCSYNELQKIEIAGYTFIYSSHETDRYYYKCTVHSFFSFDYPQRIDELSTFMVQLLNELSIYDEGKSVC